MIPFAVLALILQAHPRRAVPGRSVGRSRRRPTPAAPAAGRRHARRGADAAAHGRRSARRSCAGAPRSPPTAAAPISRPCGNGACPVPGVGDMGYFVEIQLDGQGRRGRTRGGGRRARGRSSSALDRQAGGAWGLVQVLEDKTGRGRGGRAEAGALAANEAMAVGDIAHALTAERLFMGLTNGVYGDLRCLNIPADCIEDIPEEQLLDKDLPSATEKNGYRRKFHGGARVPPQSAKGKPRPS